MYILGVDVFLIFGILDPLPPLVSTKSTQPPFLWSEFSQPPPSPSEQTSYVHSMPPNKGAHSCVLLTHREPVVEPAGEVEVARLVVEGEEGHVDLARRAELGGRRPEHVARVVDLGQAAHVLRREVVGAANRTNDSSVRVFPQKYLVSCHMWDGKAEHIRRDGRSALSSAARLPASAGEDLG